VKWLSRFTGKPYRLLSEAEYEYAARAGTQTAYRGGPEIKLNGEAMANCRGCGSQWDNKQTAPVGSFHPNGFRLYDMVGNVTQWTEDCMHTNYDGAPANGSAWTSGDCSWRVGRGCSCIGVPEQCRSARSFMAHPDLRNNLLGFRVARTLTR
jgi:formylglycine-generating enzyme required for sulfatase activity